jgi:putative mRNA 3-end processing factor
MMRVKPLLELTQSGLYCGAGNFYIDPWAPVESAVITHAHSDHARAGSLRYLTSAEGETTLRARLGEQVNISAIAYGEQIRLGDVNISLHPAGHVLGSSQVRVELEGLVWVVSGDYKTAADVTCKPFEPIRCHGFVTEATFGLPIYRWAPHSEVLREIDNWWLQNRDAGKASVLYGYSLGKAQRLLAGVDASIGPIFTHGAVERITQIYREAGVALPSTRNAMAAARSEFPGSLIVAPPSANGSAWVRRFGEFSTALASGWMRIRGHRRRRAVDRGFALSDHADWPGLLAAIKATSAETVWVTHGHSAPLARFLTEQGLDAMTISTQFEGELDEPQSSLEQDEASVA